MVPVDALTAGRSTLRSRDSGGLMYQESMALASHAGEAS